MRQYLFSLVLILSLGACASVPENLRGEYDTSATLVSVQTKTDAFIGQEVRWGGIILGVENRHDQSILEILAYPLDKSSRPMVEKLAKGRFLLQSKQFLDPAIYVPDRELTLVGTIAGAETKKIGEFEYRYVVIEGRSLHLWPEREVSSKTDYYEPWFPWYPPWYPWWDPWYGYPYPWDRHYHRRR